MRYTHDMFTVLSRHVRVKKFLEQWLREVWGNPEAEGLRAPVDVPKQIRIAQHNEKYSDIMINRDQAKADLDKSGTRFAQLIYARLGSWKTGSESSEKEILDRIHNTLKNGWCKRMRQLMRTEEWMTSLLQELSVTGVSPDWEKNPHVVDSGWWAPSEESVLIDENPPTSMREQVPESGAKSRPEEQELDNAEMIYEQAKLEHTVAQNRYSEWHDEYFYLAHEIDPSLQIDEVQQNFAAQTGNEKLQNVDVVSQEERPLFSNPAYIGELWYWAEEVRIEHSDGGYYLICDQEWVDRSWTRGFSTREAAELAKERYELFSRSPLNKFLWQGVYEFEKYRNAPKIKAVWEQINPWEPMTDIGFRRLLMVAMMKKMRPEYYEQKSYATIEKLSGSSISAQFWDMFENHKKNLDFQNNNTDDIRKMIELVHGLVNDGQNVPQDWPM